MLKKLLIVLFLFLFASFSSGISFKDADSQGVSIKAGPTDANEEVKIAWIETAIYPKNVEKGREIFIEVNLTSKMQNVFAEVDFDKNSEKVQLFSKDKLSWNCVLKTPQTINSGVHLARIIIEGKNNRKITRTLDFNILETSTAGKNLEYEITVLNETPVVENGERIYDIYPGKKVIALFKSPFYRVRLSDGKEGWIESSKVKDPSEEYYLIGYKFYKSNEYAEAERNYLQAVKINPSFTKAHYWLAKTYLKMGNDVLAIAQLQEVLKQDPNLPGIKELTSMLSENYYGVATKNFRARNYKIALQNFRRALDLNPAMITAWIKLGETYNIMGLYSDARLSWKEALKIDPVNFEARQLLGLKDEVAPNPKIESVKSASNTNTTSLINTQNKVSKNFVKETIDIIQSSSTLKGTGVSSALKSVMALTRSLGTRIYEDGWKVKATGNGFLVQYACRQERNGKVEAESFDWKIDPDTRKVVALNDNAKLLMSRW